MIQVYLLSNYGWVVAKGGDEAVCGRTACSGLARWMWRWGWVEADRVIGEVSEESEGGVGMEGGVEADRGCESAFGMG